MTPRDGATRRQADGGWTPRRHSRTYSGFVSLMKMALPALALMLVAVVAIWPQLTGEGENASPLTFASIGLRDSGPQRMVNPRFQSADDSRRPFTLTAKLAEETAPGSKVVRLEAPQADITLNSGSWINVNADYGEYSQTSQRLDLRGNVSFYHDGGYALRSQRMTVDIPAGMAECRGQVAGDGPLGEVAAEGMRLTEWGDVVTFTGKARLVLRSESRRAR